MPKAPDRIYIDKRDRELYNKLDHEEILRFKDRGGRRIRKDQFLFAMAIGFKNEIRRPLESKENWFLIQHLHPDDIALMNSIAIYATKSVEVLSDKGRVFKIAEEYAHGGIKLICDKIESTQYGKYEKKFEKELYEIYSKIKY